MGEIGYGAGGSGVAQEALGGKDDQRFNDLAEGLATDEVEVVGGGGGVSNGHIVFGAKLQEAFEAGAGVFRALAMVSVWKKESESGGGSPFRFGGGEILIKTRIYSIVSIHKLIKDILTMMRKLYHSIKIVNN